MFSIQDQISAATKSNIESQLALFNALTGKIFESVEKLVDLNLNVAKATLEESAVTSKQLLAVKDPQEFFALTTAHVQPSTEKALSYGRHVVSIASGLQTEFTKAVEAQIAETTHKVTVLVDDVTKHAPAGSENVIAFFKSAIGNANAGYEQLTKATKQAVDVLESNVASATSQFSQAVEKTANRAKK
jgi:phasin family protein